VIALKIKYSALIFCALLSLLLLTAPSSAVPSSQPLKYAFVDQVLDPYTLEVSIGKRLYTVRMLGLVPLNAQKPANLLKLSDLQVEKYVKSHLYNTFVYLECDDQERDFEDRLLVYVWLDKPEKRDDTEIRTKMMNAKLLLEGYGQWALTIPNYKYTSNLRSYSEEAQNKKIGLWAK
jgi:micrococcal nuclease